MKIIFFAKKSEMTVFAVESGLEYIRCKQRCLHYPHPIRPAILLIKPDETIQFRLIRCKVCANANDIQNVPLKAQAETGEQREGANNV